MGTITKRGTAARPRFYASYKESNGKWVMKALGAGVRTKDEAKKALAVIEANVLQGRLGIASTSGGTFGDLMAKWLGQITNRAAKKDRGMAQNHILPWFRLMSMVQAGDVKEVIRYLDSKKAQGLAPNTLKSLITILGRFWAWALERGLSDKNPIRLLPRSVRPKRAGQQTHTPWIRDDADVVKIMQALEVPSKWAFYLGNRSGIRPGELCGLRVIDLAEAEKGVIHVRHNLDSFLKEDKEGVGKTKFVPAPSDIMQVMGSYILERRANGNPNDPLFIFERSTGPMRKSKWIGMRVEYLTRAWNKFVRPLGYELTWYQATRHSFVSRSLDRGASLDEVSAAVGHSSIDITRNSYSHFIRKSFGDITRSPLNMGKLDPEPPANPSGENEPTSDSTKERRG